MAAAAVVDAIDGVAPRPEVLAALATLDLADSLPDWRALVQPALEPLAA